MKTFYVPSDVFADVQSGSYMSLLYPIAADFYHSEFSLFLRRLGNHPFQFHRKLWEFAFIEHHLATAGFLRKGSSGLCFGVGKEQLPALFASYGCRVTATDAPSEVIGASWVQNNEFSAESDDLNYQGIIDRQQFLERVKYQTCDMNNIDSNLIGYDFCWSACCLEHLGNLSLGLEFVLNSLKTLRVGGMAVHTTELNLSSNSETLEVGRTVLYRRRDLEQFVAKVKLSGHEIIPLVMVAPVTPIDHHVDVPPFENNPHLKLLLDKFITTSVGIVIRRCH